LSFPHSHCDISLFFQPLIFSLFSFTLFSFSFFSTSLPPDNPTSTPPAFHEHANACANVNPTAYAIGGWNGSDINSEGQWCTSYKVVEAYDIKNDKWSRLPDMLYARGQPVAGLLDNYLFAIGGEIKSSNSLCSLSVPVGTVGRYDLASTNSQWNFEGSIPLNLFRFVGASDNTNGSKVVYLFGGQGEYVQFSQPKNISNNMFVGYYPPQDATISYLPASLQSPSTPTLSPGGIAGIVIGVVCEYLLLLFSSLHFSLLFLAIFTDVSSPSFLFLFFPKIPFVALNRLCPWISCRWNFLLRAP